MPLLVRGSFISPIDKRDYDPVPNAFIYVADDGLIKAIQRNAPGAPITEETFLKAVGHNGELEKLYLERGEFLIPGFIDTHIVCILGCHPHEI